ncbi:sirohydrochlorin chelatase [Mycobacterium persicum]|uniref:sirohydrochlorin chelatase n=2 Tax=Mycobacterium persicum TaxID=1487726 RepID=UPI000A0D1143|nr:ferrochelatase [Mycobacterium persicum]
MRAARIVTTLVLTAHGSADPRSAANARAVADRLARLRPGVDVQVAFCEHNPPSLSEVLRESPADAIVTPLLLADAYHARVDIPRQIAGRVGSRRTHMVRQAGVLGEDDRLVTVLHLRLAELGTSRRDDALGVLVVAIGSSSASANARTAAVASKLAAGTRWAAATTAFATMPDSLPVAVDELLAGGARRLAIASWFLAPGVLTDRVHGYADRAGIPITAPLGAHHLVAETVLNRFDQAAAERIAA